MTQVQSKQTREEERKGTKCKGGHTREGIHNKTGY